MRSLFPWAFVLAPADQLLFCWALPLDANSVDGATVGDCLLQGGTKHARKSALQALTEAFVEDVTSVVEKDSAQVETLVTGSSAIKDIQALDEAEKAEGATAMDSAKVAEGDATAGRAEATESAAIHPGAGKSGAFVAAKAANDTSLAKIASTSKAEVAIAQDLKVASQSAGDRTRGQESVNESSKSIKDLAPVLLEMEDASRLKHERVQDVFALDDAALARRGQTFQIDEAGLSLHITSVPDRSFFAVEGNECLRPAKGDKLVVHYDGTLVEGGSLFDSSRKRGEPFRFTIGEGRVLKGWDLGLLSLCLGERGRLHVPSEMAYGKRGAPPRIPQDADLDFDVELLAINDVSAPQYHKPKMHLPWMSRSGRSGGSLLCVALSLLALIPRT